MVSVRPRPAASLPCSASTGIGKTFGKSVTLNETRTISARVFFPSEAVTRSESILQSSSGMNYFLGAVMRKAKFGQVHRMYKLSPKSEDNVYVLCEGVEMAVKVFRKREMLNQRGNSEEDPVAEIAAMQALALQQHQHVLACLEYMHDSENVYMVMPLYNGGDILDVKERREVLGQSRAFSQAESRHFFKQLVQGVHHLHQQGIAHRDLSIENILYDETTDSYVVIDLGASISLPRDDSGDFMRKIPKRRIFGKVSYIAPELWRKEEFFDPMLCDIWALGVILFMVMFDCAPMVKASVDDEMFGAVCNNQLHELVEPEERNEESMMAVDLMQKILRSNPDDRLSLKEIMNHPWMTLTSSC